jgi:hypothetical protein
MRAETITDDGKGREKNFLPEKPAGSKAAKVAGAAKAAGAAGVAKVVQAAGREKPPRKIAGKKIAGKKNGRKNIFRPGGPAAYTRTKKRPLKKGSGKKTPRGWPRRPRGSKKLSAGPLIGS